MAEQHSGDALIREQISKLPVPEFPETAWTTPPPLAEAKVAVVTLPPPSTRETASDSPSTTPATALSTTTSDS